MLAISIVQIVMYLAAFALGMKFFMTRKSPLYFKLLFYGVACFLLEEFYYLVDYACVGYWSQSFSFACFGASAGYAFLLSANLGQFDGFVDDGSKECKTARVIGLIAPIIFIVTYAIGGAYYIKTTGKVGYVVFTVVCKLPAFFASYFNLKHLVMVDKDHFLVDALRPCNAMCLCLIVVDVLSDVFFAIGNNTLYVAFDTLVSVFLVIIMIVAERGCRKWTI